MGRAVQRNQSNRATGAESQLPFLKMEGTKSPDREKGVHDLVRKRTQTDLRTRVGR